MQAFAAILAAFGTLGALSLLSGCGDDGDDGGSGGAAGASAGGSSSGSGGKASSGGAASGGSSSGGSGGGASGGDVCADAQALASERQDVLNCENGTGNVEAACNAVLMETPDCEDEFADVVDCGQALAASAWVCDAEGNPSTPDGTCTDELTALDDCLGL